ncbi:MAG: hypothetical protein P1P65_06210 [Treponema sp.]
MQDGGIISQDEKINQDYMDYVKTGIAEVQDGKLIFKNRMYIKKIYLPKLSKWLAYDGEDTGNHTTENPFNEYFKEGLKEGYPNILLDVALEVQGTGSGRFRSVENLSKLQTLRLVIANGKLSLKDSKEDTENPSINASLSISYLNQLFQNYYGDTGAFFSCDAWDNAKQDDGIFDPDAGDLRNLLTQLKALMRDTDKRKLPVKAEKWGYRLDGNTFQEAVDMDLVFDPAHIQAVQKVLVDNPAFDETLPEGPGNERKIYGTAQLSPLYVLTQPAPLNNKKAHHLWRNYDVLNTATLNHQIGSRNIYAVKNFDSIKNEKVEWRILYGDGYDSTPATLTVERQVGSEFTEDSPELKKNFRSNQRETGINDFDHDNPLHWKEQEHKGKIKKYKVSYTITLTFDNLSATALKDVLDEKVLTSNAFSVKYSAVDSTQTADNNFDWVYILDDYSVMEERVKDKKWLTFAEIELYGIVSTKAPNGEVTSGTEEVKLTGYLKRPILGQTVLNSQTHFFVPAVLDNGGFIEKITQIKVIPNMENIAFTLTADGFSFDGGVPVENWAARINVDNAANIDTSLPDGTRTFKIAAGELDTATGTGFNNFQGKKLTVQLVGLGEHTALRKGVNRSSTNKKEDWQGYSFVIHFGR